MDTNILSAKFPAVSADTFLFREIPLELRLAAHRTPLQCRQVAWPDSYEVLKRNFDACQSAKRTHPGAERSVTAQPRTPQTNSPGRSKKCQGTTQTVIENTQVTDSAISQMSKISKKSVSLAQISTKKGAESPQALSETSDLATTQQEGVCGAEITYQKRQPCANFVQKHRSAAETNSGLKISRPSVTLG